MLKPLSVREIQVVRLVASGRTNREIADELAISTRTVEAHRSRVMLKLGLTNLSGLVRYALRSGLIQP